MSTHYTTYFFQCSEVENSKNSTQKSATHLQILAAAADVLCPEEGVDVLVDEGRGRGRWSLALSSLMQILKIIKVSDPGQNCQDLNLKNKE